MVGLSSEFWAAITGAVVGGLISLAAQLLAFREARHARDRDRKDVQEALGLSLLFKLMEIASNLDALEKYVEEAFAVTFPDGTKPQPWQALLPLANSAERVRFSTEEIAMLLSLKNDALFNRLISFDVIHNGTIEIFDTYNRRRAAATERLSAKMTGTLGVSDLTAEQAAWLAPRAAELNELADGMRERVTKDSARGRELVLELHAALRKHFGLSFSLQITGNSP